jgi:predicted lysophospholipase L1 biosynthesis ABC-type transport system permease subunit
MTFAGDTPQLADVKAVDDRYPLYGTLQTQPPGLKPQAAACCWRRVDGAAEPENRRYD